MNYSTNITMWVVVLYLSTTSIVQGQNCIAPPIPSDDCSNVPEYSCNLDGYTGTTNGFNSGPAPFGFCGIIENDQYLSFVADESPVVLEITPFNCTTGKGIQAGIYDSPDCSTLTPISNCASYGFANTLTVTAPVVTIGKLYYLVIDGFEGDICDFTIHVISGILPNVEAVATDATMCSGASIQLDGTASTIRDHLYYEWTAEDGGNIAEGENSLTPTIDAFGTYTLTVTDTIECCIDQTTISVTEDFTLPTIALAANQPIDCNNNQVTIDATGTDNGDNFTYNWTSNDGSLISDATELNALVDNNGTYQLAVTNTLTGCTSTEDIMVQIDTMSPDLSVMVSEQITCTNTSIDLNAISNTTGVSYEWSGPNDFSSNLQNPSVGQSGSYQLVATAPNGCTQIVEATVEENTEIPSIEASVNDILDCATTQLEILGTSNTAVAFEWSGPNDFSSMNNNPTVEQPGDYMLTVTALNGCTATTNLIVQQDITTPDLSIETPDILDCVQNSIVLNSTSTTADVNYQWTGPSGFNETEADPTASVAGEYTLLLTAPNGCTNTQMVEVENDVNLPIATINLDEVLTCTTTEVTLDGSDSSPGSDFVYQWIDAQGQALSNDESIIVSNPAEYTLMVSNTTNGCSSMATINVEQDIETPTATAGQANTLTCTSSQITLDGFGSSQGDSFEYNWLNSEDISIANTLQHDITLPDTYQFIVTNTENGCTQNAFVQIDQNIETPTADAGNPSTLTCTQDQTLLNGLLSSVGDNFSHQWLNDQEEIINNDIIALVTEGGVYELIVTNTQNGCTSTASTTISEDFVAPIADAGEPVTLNCLTQSTDLDASNSSAEDLLTYEWQNSYDEIISTDVNTTISTPDTYELIVTNTENGCTAIDQVQINQDIAEPIADAGTSQTLTCTELTLSLGGNTTSTGNEYSYQWYNEQNQFIGGEPSTQITESGIYQLLVINNANGCTASDQVQIEQNITAPVATASSSPVINCIATEAQLSAEQSSSGVLYAQQWFNESGSSISEDTELMVEQGGLYELIVTNLENGCTSSDQVIIQENFATPVANATVDATLTCANTFSLLDASSSDGDNITYQWTAPNSVVISTDIEEEVDTPGQYTLLVTDTESGCTATTTVEVDQDIQAPTADAGSDQTLSCDIGQVSLGSNNSSIGTIYNYQWFDEDENLISNDLQPAINNSGIYSLVVTNTENGCSESSNVTITEDVNSPNAVVLASELPLTCDRVEAQLTATASSVSGNFEAAWLDENDQVINNELAITVNQPGIYSLIVTDTDNGCSTVETLIIEQNIEQPSFNLLQPNILTCLQTSSTIHIDGLDDETNFSYEWTNESNEIVSTDASYTSSQPGMYALLVTDNENACTSLASTQILQNIETPEALPATAETLTCAKNQAILGVGQSTEGSNVEYTWLDQMGNNLSDSEEHIVNQVGQYQLIVSNTESGCSDSAIVEIQEDKEKPHAEITNPEDLTCTNVQVTLDASNSTSTGSISYRWENSIGEVVGFEEFVVVSKPDTYTFYVKDLANGCEESDTKMVEENTVTPPLEVAQPPILDCLNHTVALNANVDQASNDFTYEWFDEVGNTLQNEQSIEVTDGGQYQVVVTDIVNGCTANRSIIVEEDVNLPQVDAGADGTLTCAITEIQLDGSNSSQGANYTYNWLNSAGQSVSTNLSFQTSQPDVYTLQILDTENDCIQTDIVEITQNLQAPNAIINADPLTLNCSLSSVILDGTASNGIDEILYQWQDDTQTNLSENGTFEVEQEGTYHLIVTDMENGCTASNNFLVQQDTLAPQGIIAPPQVLTCTNNETQLFASTANQGNFSYQWTSNDGNILQNDDTLNPTINAAGTYQLTIINLDNFCESQVQALVESDQVLPIAIAQANSVLDCVTESVELSGEGSSTGNEYEYLWTGNATIEDAQSLQPSVSEAGEYILLVSNTLNGCTSQETVLVEENENKPTAAISEAQDPDCFGFENGNIQVQEVIGGEAPYLYSFNEEAFTNQNALNNLGQGAYTLTIQDAIGCEWDTVFYLREPLEVDVELGQDFTIGLGETATLEALLQGNVQTINWVSEEALDENDVSVIEVAPLQTTVYEIEVANENGCIDTDFITIRVEKERNVYIPNVFSPNNDGTNDLFQIYAGQDVEKVNLFNVYDRWGNHVFTQKEIYPDDTEHGWDGTYNNKKMNPGVYIYYAEIEFIDGAVKVFKGDVTIF